MNTPVSAPYDLDARRLLQAAAGLAPVCHAHASPNCGRRGTLSPVLIVLHYTGGASAPGAVAWLCNRRANASAHLVISQEGKVWQLVPFDTPAWHAGISRWRGKVGLNGWSIGIEMVNCGYLQPNPSNAKAARLTATHKAETGPRSWERYPAAQVAAVAEVCAALQAHYPITEIIGHDDCAPGRKLDPGPAWDWPAFRIELAAARAAYFGVPKP